MEDQNYKIDKLSIVHEQESRAAIKLSEIEDKCNIPVIAFLKANYDSIKIRNRKTEPEIKFLIGAALLKSAVHLGLKDIDNLHKPDILNAIFLHYNDLTLEEIYKAFELERYGMYEVKTDHFQLFNAEYVTTILKKYRVFKSRLKSDHNIMPDNQDSQELSPEEKEQMVKDAVNRVFNEFIETGTIDGPTEYIFDFLVEKGNIKTNSNPAVVKYYQDKLAQAKEELKKENEKSTAKSPAEKKEFKEDLQKIISGKSGKILLRAKKNILFEYFGKQIQLNQLNIF